MPLAQRKKDIYIRPYHFVLGIFFLVSMPIIIAQFLWNRRKRPRNFEDNEIILGKYFKNIYYTARLSGNKIKQRWIVHKDGQDKTIQNARSGDKKKIEVDNYRDVEALDKYGIKASLRNTIYAGSFTCHLSASNSGSEASFTREDWDRYSDIMKRLHLVSAIDDMDIALSTVGWNNAFFRRDLYYGFKGIEREEIRELRDLIVKKQGYIKEKYGKEIISPYEDFYLYIFYQAHGDPKDFGDYVYEFQLEEFKDDLPGITEDHKKLLGEEGVYIGGGYRFKPTGHFLTVGKTRGGKGTNLIIPQLLTPEKFDGSVVALDIKGTLAAVTARHLEETGKKVIIIDPWDVQKEMNAKHSIEPSFLNPLDTLVKGSKNLVDDCDEMAELLVSFKDSDKSDRHWEDKAKEWISYYLLWMVTSMEKEDVTLYKLREMFMYDKDDRNDLFADMISFGEYDIIKQNGRYLSDSFNNTGKESQTILSTIIRAIGLYKSPMMQEATSRSDFDINDITSGNYYVFIVIPQDRLETHFRWLRATLGGMINACIRNSNKRVLMILDEFASLGKLNLATKAIAMSAEYKLSLWFVVQGLSQLKTAYGDIWETFITNSAVTTWVSLEGEETPAYLSRYMGTRHINYKRSQAIVEELNDGKLLQPERYELPYQTTSQIRQTKGIYTCISGLPPLKLKRKPYHQWDELAKRAEANPI